MNVSRIALSPSTPLHKNGVRIFATLSVALLLTAPPVHAQNVTGYQTMDDPFLFLIREPAVWQDLKLSDEQRTSLQQLNSQVDGRLLATRNQNVEQGQPILQEIRNTSREKIAQLLDDQQRQRLKQITYRLRGVRLIVIPEIEGQLQLTSQQRTIIDEIFQANDRKMQALRERQQNGESQATLDEEANALQRDEQQVAFSTLTGEQKSQLAKIVGPPFASDELGKVRFKAPAIDLSGGTVNGSVPKSAGAAGELVTIVHFFAFECINCQHNYPSYLRWQQEFAGKNVAIVGIHTPELGSEHDVALLKQRLSSEGLKFPVVVDNDKKNWDNWGNSMWPSVYLIDKQGYLRYWWYGELNWQGAPGERLMHQRVEELLAEKP